MRIFVGEYICGGGVVDQPLETVPSGLRREGAAMLTAIVSDLAEVAEVKVTLDPRLEIGFETVAVSVEAIDPSLPLWPQWVAAAADCDSALIVAPESDGVLAQSVAMLRAGGIDVIAGSGEFLRVASDKLLTAKVLTAAGVNHPPYMTLTDRRGLRILKDHRQFVVKPRDGCGTQQIQRFDSLDLARASLEENHILQAWMPGRPVSIAAVASQTQQAFLPAVSQVLDAADCQYAGGQGPLNEEDQRRATLLATRAIAALPPTVRGFVGLDLLLGERPSEDCVIEINPRLTTSYVGLRKMIAGNLAARLFDLETGPVMCCSLVNSVRWTPDGQVWVDDSVAGRA